MSSHFLKKNCLTLPLIIDPNGQFGVFMHGNRINGRNESTRYRLIAGWIDREDNHANFGYMSYRQSGNIFSFFYFFHFFTNCELFSLTLTLLSLIFFFFFFAQDSGLLGGLDIHLLILSKERGFLFFLGSLVVIFFF